MRVVFSLSGYHKSILFIALHGGGIWFLHKKVVVIEAVLRRL